MGISDSTMLSVNELKLILLKAGTFSCDLLFIERKSFLNAVGNKLDVSLAINTKSNVPGVINIGSEVRLAELLGSVVLPLNAMSVFLIQTPVLSNANRRISDTSPPSEEEDLTGNEKLIGSMFASFSSPTLSISALHAPINRASNSITSILKLFCLRICCCINFIFLFSQSNFSFCHTERSEVSC